MSMVSNYPRALPYHAAEELAMQTARLRRWTGLLFLVAGVVVLLTAAAVVFVINLHRTVAAPAAQAKPHTDPPPAEPPAKKATVADAANREALLEALGGLSAAHLYQSYLNIGLLADAVEKEAYSLEEGEKMLRSVVDLMNLTENQLAKLSRSGLDSEDQASLERIQAVVGLLRIQTNTLQTFWKSGEKAHADQYHQARDAAWTGLSKVLGLGE